MGQQHEAVYDDPFRRQQAAQVGDEEVIEEIDIDGEKYTAKSSLRKLRERLRLCGLPKGRARHRLGKGCLNSIGILPKRLELNWPGVSLRGGSLLKEVMVWGRSPYQGCQRNQRDRSTSWHIGLSKIGACNVLQRGTKSWGWTSHTGQVGVPCDQHGLLLHPWVDRAHGSWHKEDLRLYGGDLRGGVALVVTDDWSRGVLALPVPGKGRQHAKYLAEQIVRYISACGFSTCILKADAEPSTRLLLDIVSKAWQKLGFKTVVELAGPEDSQGNGRVEREIQTVRGLALEHWSAQFEKEPKQKWTSMVLWRSGHFDMQLGFSPISEGKLDLQPPTSWTLAGATPESWQTSVKGS